MTVGELKKALDGIDEDRIVILQKDSEGNGFSPLDSLDDNATYETDPDSGWSGGEVALEKLTPELEAQGWSEDDIGEGPKALVLVPTN